MVSAWEITSINKHLLYRLIKTIQFHIADSNKDRVFENKVNRLYFVVILQEVTIRHDTIVRLDITAGELNLLHFFIFLNIYLKESL